MLDTQKPFSAYRKTFRRFSIVGFSVARLLRNRVYLFELLFGPNTNRGLYRQSKIEVKSSGTYMCSRPSGWY